jgi:glycolate oxidase
MPASSDAIHNLGEVTRAFVEKYGATQPAGGRAPQAMVAQLLQTYGDCATDCLYECGFYRRDVAPLPAVFDTVFRTLPDVVVRPTSTDEVAQVVTLAHQSGTSITVRAGASTSLGGCVPLRGGLVLDLSTLRGVVEVDEARRTALVLAGTVWTELERSLGAHGLAPQAVPSSAPASSVGGWLCTGGYGIGSLKYGAFVNHVRRAEAVLPDGTVHWLTEDSDPPLRWFAGSEGTLGVITQLELDVREDLPMKHALLACHDIAQLQRAVQLVLQQHPAPYSIHFDDRHVLHALAALDFAPDRWDGEHLVRLDWEGESPELEAADRIVDEIKTAIPSVRFLPEAMALSEWRERFQALRVKRGGPSVAGAEVLLPVDALAAYLRDVDSLAAHERVQLMTYGHLANPKWAIVMTMYYTDETRMFDYLLDLGLVKKLHDISASHGGSPYGLGLWNTPHRRARCVPTSKELLYRKWALDRTGVMNPGKGVARLAIMNPRVVRAGMGALSAARRVLRRAPR